MAIKNPMPTAALFIIHWESCCNNHFPSPLLSPCQPLFVSLQWLLIFCHIKHKLQPLLSRTFMAYLFSPYHPSFTIELSTPALDKLMRLASTVHFLHFQTNSFVLCPRFFSHIWEGLILNIQKTLLYNTFSNAFLQLSFAWCMKKTWQWLCLLYIDTSAS